MTCHQGVQSGVIVIVTEAEQRFLLRPGLVCCDSCLDTRIRLVPLAVVRSMLRCRHGCITGWSLRFSTIAALCWLDRPRWWSYLWFHLRTNQASAAAFLRRSCLLASRLCSVGSGRVARRTINCSLLLRQWHLLRSRRWANGCRSRCIAACAGGVTRGRSTCCFVHL